MTGFIPQITTRVNVEANTDGLDDAIKEMASDNILSSCFSEVIDYLEDKKKEAIAQTDPLAYRISERLQDNQYHRIKAYHRVSGLMANSVEISKDYDAHYLVGNTATSYDGFPYPLAIEFGRREVHPVEAEWLRWWNKKGEIVFAKKSRAYKGDPFVQDSIDMTNRQVDKQVEDYLQDVFGD